MTVLQRSNVIKSFSKVFLKTPHIYAKLQRIQDGKLIIYLVGCAGSQLQHMGSLIFVWHTGSLVKACKLIAAACGIQFPRPGIETRAPAQGAHSLSHWTAREVPRQKCLFPHFLSFTTQKLTLLPQSKKLVFGFPGGSTVKNPPAM